MRTLLVMSIVLAASPALADPPPCEVRIARAPDEVRAAIESWLASETHCNVELELRAVPTQGGFYLLARDRHGRVRERVVPDAQSAGVLVASWAADDELDGPPPHVIVDPSADDGVVAPVPAPPPATPEPAMQQVTAPGLVDSAPAEQPSPGYTRRLGVYIQSGVAGTQGEGLRGELDVWQRAGWSLGAAASIAQDDRDLSYFDGYSETSGATLRDIKLMAYGARTVDFDGVLHVRAAIGAGAVITTTTIVDVMTGAEGFGPISDTYVRPTAEATLMAGIELGRGWSFELGAMAQAFLTANLAIPINEVNDAIVTVDRGVSLSLLGGLAHRL